MFNGQCEEALHFYAAALGGEVSELSRYSDSPAEGPKVEGDKVLHAHLLVQGQPLLMASDSGFPEAGPEGSGAVHLSLNFTSEAEQEAAFQALAQNGKVNMPLQDTFWGARFGMLTDQYGINWMFNYDRPQQ
jgi:PhnB protein